VQERGWRTGLKPLNVVQPEGPSFSVDGNMVFWQKWSMRVSFNYREGLVLHTVGSVSAAPFCSRSSTAHLQHNLCCWGLLCREGLQRNCACRSCLHSNPPATFQTALTGCFYFHWMTLCDASGSTHALHLHQQPNLENTAGQCGSCLPHPMCYPSEHPIKT